MAGPVIIRDGGILYIDVPSSQMTLLCVKLLGNYTAQLTHKYITTKPPFLSHLLAGSHIKI